MLLTTINNNVLDFMGLFIHAHTPCNSSSFLLNVRPLGMLLNRDHQILLLCSHHLTCHIYLSVFFLALSHSLYPSSLASFSFSLADQNGSESGSGIDQSGSASGSLHSGTVSGSGTDQSGSASGSGTDQSGTGSGLGKW